MKNMRKLYRILALSVLGAGLLLPQFAKAQQAGVQVSPLTFNFEISPGGSQDLSVNITNLNTTDLNYVMEFENFNSVSEEGAPSFKGLSSDVGITTLKDWITVPDLSNKEGVIEAKQNKDINLKIDVPKGAEAGGHYAAVFAKEVIKNAEGKTELGVATRVGALILVTVPGDIIQSAKITEFNYPKFVWTGPVDFAAKVENTGNVHYDSKVTVAADPLLGSDKEIDLGTHTVIPANTRLFEGKWDNKYPFGYYKLTATATAGDGTAATAAGTLIAIPLVIVLPVLVGLILLVYLVRYIKSHVKIVK